ncbi:hypothetical protein BCR43DRAFT_18336 [Syncephalastrum racemosum]|uniref:Uncharacterized protein n=1 Tax=Syncephalastrum racemosum TaxID=13706 RepID=A0A1X2HSX1_SYNRA|nr:hypothetical protein BCR43DRAFT_18336 [Syncephalastrum racemosum]
MVTARGSLRNPPLICCACSSPLLFFLGGGEGEGTEGLEKDRILSIRFAKSVAAVQTGSMTDSQPKTLRQGYRKRSLLYVKKIHIKVV